MATLKDVYKKLFEGKRIALRCDSRAKYNSIRTSLHREHSLITAMDLSDQSLCQEWDEEGKVASFWLGTSRKQRAGHFEILGETNEQKSAGA